MISTLGKPLQWQSEKDTNSLILKKNELHLWWLPLELGAEQQKIAHTLLNQRQLDKYKRRATPQLQHAYLASRYHLLTLLAAYQNCKPHEIELSYSRLNKPFIDSKTKQDSLQFNFTDTSANDISYGLYAFCWNRQVGVDLEALNRSGDFARIAKRRFTPPELEYVSQDNGELDTHKCLAIWTRKEAYGKATGKGINFQMNERNLRGHNPHEHEFNDSKEDWRLIQVQPDNDFIGCVVHETHQPLTIKAFNSLPF